MKRIAVGFVILALSALMSGCAGSSAVIGDKELDGVVDAKESVIDLIQYYQDQVADRQEENENLSINLEDCAGIENPAVREASMVSYRRQIAENDSIISGYRKKINRLEGEAEDILVRGAGKDKITSVVLNGRNPREVADAYATVRYLDNIGKGNHSGASADAGEDGSSELRGIVENRCYYPVIAKVTGPLGFYREFTISPRGFSPVFSLPIPGEYSTGFTNCNNSQAGEPLTKTVGLNIIYYVGEETYNYKATAMLP